ncbi:glycosyltransferase, partial [Verrucomicrobia bacterium]|nr:glycosyltransferase [Verrucomicrobiota bacterium]
FLLARKLQLPLLTQMHDLWYENTKLNSFSRALARKYEKVIFQYADKNFCMTSTQQDYFKKKYPDLTFDMLPHCVPKSEENYFRKTSDIEKNEYTILYTGNISRAMNLDALQQLLSCIKYLPKKYRIKMLVSLSEQECKNYNIYHEDIIYDWVSVEQSKKLIRKADLLFLPLSFNNCSTHEVRTVYATKTLDYLKSGTPILVFSPPESFHSMDASCKGWGYVVDKDDPEFLAQSIIKVLQNEPLKRNLVLKAQDEAKNRHPDFYCNYLNTIIEVL